MLFLHRYQLPTELPTGGGYVPPPRDQQVNTAIAFAVAAAVAASPAIYAGGGHNQSETAPNVVPQSQPYKPFIQRAPIYEAVHAWNDDFLARNPAIYNGGGHSQSETAPNVIPTSQ